MAVRKHLFSLFSLLSLAVVLASFEAIPANALSLEHHQHHARSLHQHNLLAKKRSTMQKRCKSRPTPSSAPVPASSPAPPASSKVAAAVPGSSPAPAKQSSAAPAPPSPSPSPQSKPSSPAAPPPQSTSSSSVAQRLKAIFPRKYFAAFGGSPSELSEWDGVDAYYNWDVQPTGPGGPLFIATLWGTRNQAAWQSDVVNAKTPPAMVKTYNECEISSQCNMSPGDAAIFWNANVLPVIERGTLTACPAVTSDPGAQEWLEAFFSSCNNGHPNCGCSVLDVHYYGTDTEAFITWIQGMQQQFQMQMIVSEFACQSFVPNTQQCDPSQIQKFAATMTSFFQNTDYIAAYAPFGIMHDLGNVNPENGLMNPDGSPDQLAMTYFPSL